ncbi:MAG: hypothetical protein RLY70_181, partial [Planctomycetota bacterium]
KVTKVTKKESDEFSHRVTGFAFS